MNPPIHNASRTHPIIVRMFMTPMFMTPMFIAAVCGSFVVSNALRESHGQVGAPPARVVFGKDRFARCRIQTWKGLREQHVVMQQKDFSCGAAALATIMRYTWNRPITEKMVLKAIVKELSAQELQNRVEHGLALADLENAAIELGFEAMIGERSLTELLEAKIPVLLRIKQNRFEHFVVFRGVVLDRVFLADPLRGNVRISIREFAKIWTDGSIMVVIEKGAEEPPDTPLLATPNRIPVVQPELQTVRSRITNIR